MVKEIVTTVGVSIGLIILWKNRKTVLGVLGEIGEGIAEMFEPRIEDCRRLRRWRLPLAYHGIYTQKDLIEAVQTHGLHYIWSFEGIGEIGINEIRIFIKQKTGIWYQL